MILGTTLVFGGCGLLGSDDDGVQFEDGIVEGVWEFLDEEQLDILEEELEMPIHRGDNPPQIPAEHEAYFISPLIMIATTVPDDFAEPGHRFADQTVRFSNQNMDEYTINVDQFGGRSVTAGDGSFIVGDGNAFTIFARTQTVIEAENAESEELVLYSGVLSEDGIVDLHFALFMLDNNGHEVFIANDTGRSFEDGEGLSEVVEWPEESVLMSPADQIERIKPDPFRILN